MLKQNKLSALLFIWLTLFIMLPLIAQWELEREAQVYGQGYIGRTPCNELVFIYSANYFAQNCQSPFQIIATSSSTATTVINSAITALTTGGELYITNGTYSLSGSLVGTNLNNINIQGAGRSTYLKAATDATPSATCAGQAILCLYGVTGWTISDIQFDGNAANNPSCTYICHGLFIELSSHIILRNLYIHNALEFGGEFSSTSYSEISDSYLYENQANGFNVYSNAGQIAQGDIVQNNVVNASSDMGISVYAADTLIQGNVVANITGTNSPFYSSGVHRAIYVGDVGNSSRVTIANNVVYNIPDTKSDGAIESQGVTLPNYDINIIGNSLNQVGTGIKIQNTNHAIVQGNTIKTTTSNAAGSGNGIYIPATGVSNDLQVIGNQINDTLENGIFMQGTGTVSVVGNSIISSDRTPSGQAAIYDDSNNATIQDDIIDAAAAEVNGNTFGIFLNAVSYNSVIGNTVRGNITATNGGAGIMISSSPYNTIVGNTVDGFGSDIKLNNAASIGNVITGNTLSLKSSYNTISTNAASVTDIVTDNQGFNPQLTISNFIYSSSPTYLITPFGTSSSLTASTTYTETICPVLIIIKVVGSASISIQGQAAFTPAIGDSFYLYPSQTINFGAYGGSPPTIQVIFS